MTKKIVAKTNISYGTPEGKSVELKPGDDVNAGELGMTEAQLKELYDAGAIELQETVDKREKVGKEELEAKEAAEVVSPAKTAPTKAVKPSGSGNPT